MIPNSTSYKLVRRSDNQIVDEGSKAIMKKKLKGVSETYFVGYSPADTSVIGSVFGKAKAIPKHKPIKINRPLNTMTKKELDFIKSQFPAASLSDMAKANQPRKKYEYFSNGKPVDPKPKTGLFRTKSEGRKDGVMPKKKIPVLKLEVWNGNKLINFFRVNGLHADRTDGWFITFNIPSRKMTAEDQLELMLAHGDTEYEVQINRIHKHLIIDSLEGNPPA